MDLMLNVGQGLNKMRLTLEGAAVLFENDLSGCYRAALDAGQLVTALALDMLGTALNELRQDVTELQAAVVNSNKRILNQNFG